RGRPASGGGGGPGWAVWGRWPPAAGGPVGVTVALGAVGHVFRAGHRIRLEIAASNAPRFDVHPAVLAHHTVHHGGDHPSHLLLPCLPGG
ncbi:CocE/NonD family hydrolase C-terminal non-catalytic domain-containing protein, partial [Streptomyces virginiae]|uniref:CocE/NonD family hydrolase C-terminal non-catalytic domain-containing protein n=1 Tax=Streptomyces virginiae TaxID=1961 RepID=UPI003673774A